jgi:putative ABC transport system permease protein
MTSRPLPPYTEDVADRRANSVHTSMFVRMLVRAAVLRRGRAASALIAMVVAAAVATAMLNLYVDVQAKLRKEFRNYGANVVVVAKEGGTFPAGSLQTVETALAGRGLAVPFAYVVARTSDGQSVIVAGTDFARVRQLDRWWSVTAWPESSAASVASSRDQTQSNSEVAEESAAERRQNAAYGVSRGLDAQNDQAPDGRKTLATPALVGVRAAALVTPQGKPFDLSFEGRTLHLNSAGTLQTGAAEDSRIYVALADFEAWTGIHPSTIEIAASGPPEEISATIQQLTKTIPDADVRPVRQIMEGEARVLGKTRATLLMSAILIILTAALCVLATLIGWVFDRRRDFAIMKALGASEFLINGFFAAEAAALGVVGALLGFAVGVGVAAWIGRVNFNAAVVPRLGVLPPVLLGSVAVALLSAILPISLLRRVQPASILRGE